MTPYVSALPYQPARIDAAAVYCYLLRVRGAEVAFETIGR